MRTDTIVKNNKELVKKHNGLKTQMDVSKATLDVMTDISETLAGFLDFMTFVYNRQIAFPGDKVPEEMKNNQNGGNGNG